MARYITAKQRFRRVFFFFPFQLVFLHLKRNHLLLLFWAALWAFISQNLAAKFGIPNLFLYPEYTGNVGFTSYFILGFSVGGFIMAFNTYSYIIHGHRFPFIATISKPFLKFSINNFILPLLFVGAHIYFASEYQINKELVPPEQVIYHISAYLLGMVLFLFISYFYFIRTNKDLYKILSRREADQKRKEARRRQKQRKFSEQRSKWYRRKKKGKWHVETYLTSPFHIRLARGSEHYEDHVLQRVFFQNHLNASLFEIVVIASFFLIGSFSQNPIFLIPAGATIVLLFTMILMVASALYSWMKSWTLTLFLLLLVAFNYASMNYDWLNIESHGYGMDRKGEMADYTPEHLQALRNDSVQYKEDHQRMIRILERWKARNSPKGDSALPWLVVGNVSGGGLRSSLWTVRTLQTADSLTNGKLLDQLHLISGSSGGMIGAAYMREHLLRKRKNPEHDLYDPSYLDAISKDLLNPVAFSIATNDIIIRYQSYKTGGKVYTRDRGSAFEEQLNKNTSHVFDKPLKAYTEPVRKSLIPMMVCSPSIVNDGRRLLITSQPASYFMHNLPQPNVTSTPLVEDIDFLRFFKEQGAENLRFTSVLRMSATFPYILPMVSLPSKPAMEVMDAGLRDNYGYKTSYQFLYHFRDWIEKNTKGVILLRIRDKEKEGIVDRQPPSSLVNRFISPLESLYGNVFKIQDYEQGQLTQHISAWFDGPIKVIPFELYHTPRDRISLSLHLTKVEKQQIEKAIHHPKNQASLKELKRLLGK